MPPRDRELWRMAQVLLVPCATPTCTARPRQPADSNPLPDLTSTANVRADSGDNPAAFKPDYLADVQADTVDGNTRVTYTINPKATYNDGLPIDWTAFEAT